MHREPINRLETNKCIFFSHFWSSFPQFFPYNFGKNEKNPENIRVSVSARLTLWKEIFRLCGSDYFPRNRVKLYLFVAGEPGCFVGQDHPKRRGRKVELQFDEHQVLLLGRRQRPQEPPKRDSHSGLERHSKRGKSSENRRTWRTQLQVSRRIQLGKSIGDYYYYLLTGWMWKKCGMSQKIWIFVDKSLLLKS